MCLGLAQILASAVRWCGGSGDKPVNALFTNSLQGKTNKFGRIKKQLKDVQVGLVFKILSLSSV